MLSPHPFRAGGDHRILHRKHKLFWNDIFKAEEVEHYFIFSKRCIEVKSMIGIDCVDNI